MRKHSVFETSKQTIEKQNKTTTKKKHMKKITKTLSGCLIRCCLDDNKIILGTKHDTPFVIVSCVVMPLYYIVRAGFCGNKQTVQTPTQLNILVAHLRCYCCHMIPCCITFFFYKILHLN